MQRVGIDGSPLLLSNHVDEVSKTDQEEIEAPGGAVADEHEMDPVTPRSPCRDGAIGVYEGSIDSG